jgi:hypothetical protein
LRKGHGRVGTRPLRAPEGRKTLGGAVRPRSESTSVVQKPRRGDTGCCSSFGLAPGSVIDHLSPLRGSEIFFGAVVRWLTPPSMLFCPSRAVPHWTGRDRLEGAASQRTTKWPSPKGGLAITPRTTTIGSHRVMDCERIPRFGWHQIPTAPTGSPRWTESSKASRATGHDAAVEWCGSAVAQVQQRPQTERPPIGSAIAGVSQMPSRGGCGLGGADLLNRPLARPLLLRPTVAI